MNFLMSDKNAKVSGNAESAHAKYINMDETVIGAKKKDNRQ